MWFGGADGAARANIGINRFYPAYLLPKQLLKLEQLLAAGPILHQCRPEPRPARGGCGVTALDLVRLAAQAALSRRPFNKRLGTGHQVFVLQVVVLRAQVARRLLGPIPRAIAVELATRVFKRGEEVGDFLLGGRRLGGLGEGAEQEERD